MPGQINVADFDLAATLECGQAFRWQRQPDGWFEGVVGHEVWRLRQDGTVVHFEVGAASPPRPGPSNRGGPSPRRSLPRNTGWSFGHEVWRLRQDGTVVHFEVGAASPPRPGPSNRGGDAAPTTELETIRRYLSLDVSLPAIVATFPDDPVLRAAVNQHWGLRVLRQAPWETLASFIASSTKQIVQIRQIVAELARRFGDPIADGYYSFPAVDVIARATHPQLWDCKLGFRAKYLLAAARMIDSGKIDWARVTVGAASPPRSRHGGTGTPLPPPPGLDYDAALAELMKLPGVGEKIALCTLLFSCGFNQAFPIDVWVERALRRLYFPEKKVTSRELREFTRSHFGPYAGWAQQYLFFGERQRGRNRE